MRIIGIRTLLAKPDPEPTAGAIIRWWEARRLHYNVLILVWALILYLAAHIETGRIDPEAFNLASLYVYLLLFQLPANIFYTGGWIADLVVKKVLRLPSARFGPFALGLGIAVSLLFYLGIAAYFWVAEKR